MVDVGWGRTREKKKKKKNLGKRRVPRGANKEFDRVNLGLENAESGCLRRRKREPQRRRAFGGPGFQIMNGCDGWDDWAVSGRLEATVKGAGVVLSEGRGQWGWMRNENPKKQRANQAMSPALVHNFQSVLGPSTRAVTLDAWGRSQDLRRLDCVLLEPTVLLEHIGACPESAAARRSELRPTQPRVR